MTTSGERSSIELPAHPPAQSSGHPDVGAPVSAPVSAPVGGPTATAGQLAERLQLLLGPIERTLDIGCRDGRLVQAMLSAGADAYGLCDSQAVLESAPAQLRDRLRYASITDPIEGHYDLITCVEALEPLTAAQIETALDGLCAATDRLVLASAPVHSERPESVTVRPTADWVASLAARGFFRRTDLDLGFVSPRAACFERGTLSVRDVVHRYESLLETLLTEVHAKRAALAQAQRALAVAADGAEVIELRHAVLTARDHARGAEAQAGVARGDTAIMALRVRDLQAEIDAMLKSERWRLGGALLAPTAAVRRRMKGS